MEVATLWRVLVGSRGYGLNTPATDTDVMEVVAHGKENYFGVTPYSESSHLKSEGAELVKYDVRFYAKMLVKGSFNAVLPLFFPFEKTFMRSEHFVCFSHGRRHFLTERFAKNCVGFANRSLKEFQEKGSFKTAANGLYVLGASSHLFQHAFDLENFDVGVFRDVKAGNFSAADVVQQFEWALANYETKVLANTSLFNAGVEGVATLFSSVCLERVFKELT